MRKLGNQLRHGLHVALARDYNAAKDGVYAHAPISSDRGLFEGLGNTISNLSIFDSTDSDSVGLFSGNVVSIRNLSMEKVNVIGTGNNQSIGGLAGGNEGGTIANCSVSGIVSGGTNYVGGLVGHYSGRAGDGIILGSRSLASVSAGSNSLVGGLVGLNEGLIDQSYATGAVSGGDGSFAGGLAGWTDGEQVEAKILDSFATGAVSGGNDSFVGGLLGTLSGAYGYSQRSYSLGAVSGGSDAKIGGFVGKDVDASGHDADNYWDLDTSGISDPHRGAGNVQDDPGITGLSDVQLKSALPAGFDPAIWGQKPNVNSGYPYLLSNPPS